ncbi:MAG: hypothetical protein M1826_005846 [Phylliscum demangeonii]|nr:MAG: hypothetical protein M1826_005846 [Phylliscum demangeonii]
MSTTASPASSLMRERSMTAQSHAQAQAQAHARPHSSGLHAPHHQRPFSGTAAAHRGRDRELKAKPSSSSSSSSKQQRGKPHSSPDDVQPAAGSSEAASAAADAAELDPFDMAALRTGLDRAVSRLTESLSQLRAGGRFNPALLEALRVRVAGPDERGSHAKTDKRSRGAAAATDRSSSSNDDRDGGASVRLGDVAQVIPRGARAVRVLVGEKAHVKSILSAIRASPYSLNPTSPSSSSSSDADETDDGSLEIHIPLPTPTAEARADAGKQVAKLVEHGLAAVRVARQAEQRRLKRCFALAPAPHLGRRVWTADDRRQADRLMDRDVDAAIERAKREGEGARSRVETMAAVGE